MKKNESRTTCFGVATRRATRFGSTRFGRFRVFFRPSGPRRRRDETADATEVHPVLIQRSQTMKSANPTSERLSVLLHFSPEGAGAINQVGPTW